MVLTRTFLTTMKTLPRTLAVLSIASVALMSGCAPRSPTRASDSAQVDHSTMTASQHAAMHGGSTGDSTFAEMQKRGGMAMGVDQYTSKHVFETTPTGGSISLQRETEDSVGVAQIRAHMKLIQHAFASGDFSTPAFVHARDMPGTAVMAARRDAISYRFEERPRGGRVVLRSEDHVAVRAIGEFLEAQRKEHR